MGYDDGIWGKKIGNFMGVYNKPKKIKVKPIKKTKKKFDKSSLEKATFIKIKDN